MKKHHIFLGLAIFFASCSQSEIDSNSPGANNDQEGIVCNVQPLEFVDYDSSTTRSTLSHSTDGMSFAWEENEIITVYGDGNNIGNFSFTAFRNEDHSTASFTGGGFNLTKGKTYYSFSKSKEPFNATGSSTKLYNYNYAYDPNGIDISQKTNIKVSYAGQRALASKSTDHLGKYDFMVARATAEQENNAQFNYVHLGATLRMIISGGDDQFKTLKFNKLEVYDATDDGFREPNRTFNITSSAETYSPAFNTLTADEVAAGERFTMALGNEDGTGISADASDKNRIQLYMELPPYDFTGKTIRFKLSRVDGGMPYVGTYTGKPILAGTAYQMSFAAKESTGFTANVRVQHSWQKGNSTTTEMITRTGDPGNSEKFETPTHLYAFFVNNELLIDTYTNEALSESDWTTSNNISTLKSPLTFDLNGEVANNPKIYIIASRSALSFSVTKKSTTEVQIKALTYTYDEGTIADIYSTPYSGTNFTGAFTLEDNEKDVTLYHVASKVDINWKNTTSTGLTGQVYVSKFPTANLSFFSPSTGNTTINESSVSRTDDITPGTAYTGRAVFYLPQPSNAKYQVTIGDKTQDITFIPDNVYTSWFLGNVKLK